MLRATVVWFGLFIIAFTNGAIREVGIKKFIEEPWAHHVSALTAVFLFSSYVYLVWSPLQINSIQQSIVVGVYWLALTFFTETFILGRLIAKHSWQEIFKSYDLLAGNLWPLVLLWVGLLPVIMAAIRIK